MDRPRLILDFIRRLRIGVWDWVANSRFLKSGHDTQANRPAISLSPLTPKFDESKHKVYYNLLEVALHKDNASEIRNIALSGGYGVGKSSILQKVAETHKRTLIQVSLSSLGDSGYHVPGESITNRIQKEIVKQLLYSEAPASVPNSRFRRIGRFGWRYGTQVAAVAAAMLTSLFLLTGWTSTLLSWAEDWTVGSIEGIEHLLLFSALFGVTYWVQHLFHNRLHIQSFTAGPATVSLASEQGTYFDQYLDEIVYFFESTSYDIVVLEDIDRFDDVAIFECLRALNTLLNSTNQLKGRDIRFIYAIKDSIFDKIGTKHGQQDQRSREISTEDADSEPARANRTKFFDLVVPVVPFVTPQNARELMRRELNNAGSEISEDLIRLTAVHITDMRMIKNVSNELLIFQDRLLSTHQNKLRLSHDLLFAMLLYKQFHMGDFDKIRLGDSDLDKLYNDWRNLIETNIRQIRQKEADIRRSLATLDQLPRRAAELGGRLNALIDLFVTPHLAPRKTWAIYLSGERRPESDIHSEDFWRAVAELPDDNNSPLEIRFQNQSGAQTTLSTTIEELRHILNDSLSPSEWKAQEVAQLEAQLEELRTHTEFLKHADFQDMINEDRFQLDGRSLRELSEARLPSKLARQLVHHGYINRDFALYTTIYYADMVSIAALNFIMHHVDRNIMSISFQLTPSDVRSILNERGNTILSERSMYNIHVMDFLLSTDYTEKGQLIKTLTRFGQDEEQFLSAYYIEGHEKCALIREQAQIWPRVFTFIASVESISQRERSELVNIALQSANKEIEYSAGGGIKELVEANFSTMEVFTVAPDDEEVAERIASLSQTLAIKLPDLTRLDPRVRAAIVAKNCYQITWNNIVQVLEGADNLPLDKAKIKNDSVYKYLVGNLGAYLDALQNGPVKVSTIASSSDFASVVSDVAGQKPELLPNLLHDAARECLINDITTTPVSTWRDLAAQNRFEATLENVRVYFDEIGEIDAPLASLLGQAKRIKISGDVPEQDKRRLAKEILRSIEVIPKTHIRVALVASLEPELLGPDDIPRESGPLIGLLLKAQLVEDNQTTYELTRRHDWTTREFFISKSKKFVTYMSPELVPTVDIEPLLQSDAVPSSVKNQLLERSAEFILDHNHVALTAIGKYALENEVAIDLSTLTTMATARQVDRHMIIQLLEPLLEELSEDELSPLLAEVGNVYAEVSERNGRRPQLPNSAADKALVQRLENLKIVSTYKVDGDGIKVNMKTN